MFKIVPRREKFFDLFKESAQNALAGAKALKEMLENYTDPQQSWNKALYFGARWRGIGACRPAKATP